jgi:hypothetical protein
MFSETPFPEIETYTVHLEPFLNTYYKEYQNILTVDRTPGGVISQFVKRVNAPVLSPFNTFPSPLSPVNNCLCAFVRNPDGFTMKNNNPFLNERDIPSLLAFLRTHGYTVDMETVKIMHKAGIQSADSKRMIFVFTKSD